MAKIRIVGDSSGYVELAAPNAAGNNTLELPSNATKLVGADANNNVNLSGIITATTFSGRVSTTGISTFSSGINVGTGASISSPATNVLTLGTNNTEAVRITDAGLVGIGTITIGNKLSVGGETAQYPVSVQIYSTLHSTSRRAAIGLGGTPGNTDPDWLILQDRTGNGTKNLSIYNRTLSENVFNISSPQLTEPNYYINTPNSSTGATYGLDIGYRRAVAISGNVSANTWTNSTITQKSTGDQGIFLLDVWADTYAAGGESYQTSYIGWFVLPNRNSNSTNTSTITVHYTGHAPNTEVFQFRTLNEMDASGGRIYLQFLTNKNLTGLDGTGGKNVTIYLHRFGSAVNNV